MHNKFKLLLLFLFPFSLSAQVQFDDFFLPKTMRLDYTHAGNADTSYIYFEQIKQEPFWGGSHTHLVDTFNFGDYMLSVFDKKSGKLIYSRGYSSLFREWQDTDEAKKLNRSYYENVVFPFPKKTVRVEIAERDKNYIFQKKFEIEIDPDNYFIIKEMAYNFEVKRLHAGREPEHSLDIVVIPEGYTANEMQKFEEDSKRFINYFFGVSPFKENSDKVNFWAVMSPSKESGTDIPADSVWKNTLCNSHFYTFDSERYLTTRDMRTVRDLAALAPYDQIYILVNTDKYGGGGIFNYYNLCVSDHEFSREVFTHEFGHAFAALADEYAYEDIPAEEKYNMQKEPWQANISNLTNFASKWKDLVPDSIPIPTPDSLSNTLGAFEGGGYVQKRIYRPSYDCKMRSNKLDYFCPVCFRTVLAMLNFYTE